MCKWLTLLLGCLDSYVLGNRSRDPPAPLPVPELMGVFSSASPALASGTATSVTVDSVSPSASLYPPFHSSSVNFFDVNVPAVPHLDPHAMDHHVDHGGSAVPHFVGDPFVDENLRSMIDDDHFWK